MSAMQALASPKMRAALCAAALGVMSLSSVLVVWAVASFSRLGLGGLGWFVSLTAAFFVARLLTTRLPQGDEVSVTSMVGVYGLAVADVRLVVVSALAAGLLDVAARRAQLPGNRLWLRLVDVMRGAAVLGLMSPWHIVLSRAASYGGVDDSVVGLAMTAGLICAGLDITTVAVMEWATGGESVWLGARGLGKSLGAVYVVHAAMAAVSVRLSGVLSVWAFPVALLLTLILQNSLNLYLRVRRGYAETIGALAHAAELDRPQDSGHARRVADMSVEVGRRLGMNSAQLERIGYAALLHDIGRMGRCTREEGDTSSRRGIDIVESIPFLADIAPLIDAELADGRDWQVIAAGLIRLCSQFDRMRAQLGTQAALDTLQRRCHPADERSVVALKSVVEARYHGVFIQ